MMNFHLDLVDLINYRFRAYYKDGIRAFPTRRPHRQELPLILLAKKLEHSWVLLQLRTYDPSVISQFEQERCR
jgi:hypothetical protein